MVWGWVVECHQHSWDSICRNHSSFLYLSSFAGLLITAWRHSHSTLPPSTYNCSTANCHSPQATQNASSSLVHRNTTQLFLASNPPHQPHVFSFQFDVSWDKNFRWEEITFSAFISFPFPFLNMQRLKLKSMTFHEPHIVSRFRFFFFLCFRCEAKSSAEY